MLYTSTAYVNVFEIHQGFLVARLTTDGGEPVSTFRFARDHYSIHHNELTYTGGENRYGVSLVIERTGDLSQPARARFEMREGTAHANRDYQAFPSETIFEFIPNQASRSIFIPIARTRLAGDLPELPGTPRSFSVRLTDPDSGDPFEPGPSDAVIDIHSGNPPLFVRDSVVPADDLRVPFGMVVAGQELHAAITLRNDSSFPSQWLNLRMAFDAMSDPQPFRIEEPCVELGAGFGQDQCTFQVFFAPSRAGDFSGFLVVEYTGASEGSRQNQIGIRISGSAEDQADLAITKSVVNGMHWAKPGDIIPIRVNLFNRGPLDAPGVRATVEIPELFRGIPLLAPQATLGGLTVNLPGGLIHWDIDSLAAHQTAALTYSVLIPPIAAPIRIESAASVAILAQDSGSVRDDRQENNFDSTYVVIGGADLAARGSSTDLILTARPMATFYPSIKNHGPEASAGFTIRVWHDQNLEIVRVGTRWTQVNDGNQPKWQYTGTGSMERRFDEGEVRWIEEDKLPAHALLEGIPGLGYNLKPNARHGQFTVEVTPADAASDINPANNIRAFVVYPRPMERYPEVTHCYLVFLAYLYCVLGNNPVECDRVLHGIANLIGTHDAHEGEPEFALSTYYAMRDVLRQNETGQSLIRLYETHSPELIRILIANLGTPGFLDDSLAVVRAFHQGYARYTAGSGDSEFITQEMIDRLNQVADQYSELGSQELREAIEVERQRYNHLQDFVGVSFADWGRILGIRVPDSPWLVVSSARRLEERELFFELNHVPGHVYSVWRSGDLQSPDWVEVEEALIEVVGHSVRVRLPGDARPQDYYRVRAVSIVQSE